MFLAALPSAKIGSCPWSTSIRPRPNLSRLLARVEAGEEVVIARRGNPVARLVRCKPREKRQLGALKEKVVMGDSFFAPSPRTN